MRNRLLQALAQPVSGASLGFFRVSFGLVMLYEAYAFLQPSFLLWPERGPNLVEQLYTGDHVHWHIPYPGFSWLRPLPEPWTSVLFAVFAVAALLVTVGWLYRAAIFALWGTFTYIILMDAAWYLNHFYLSALLAFLLIWMPADRRLSLRRLMNLSSEGKSSLPGEVPFWCIFLLRAQLFIMYFYAGIAKLSPDWLAGEPLRMWLHDAFVGRRLETLIGPTAMQAVRQWIGHEAVIHTMAYGGLVFDLAIGPLLLWRRTRWMAMIWVVAFHATNYFLFDIGAFPVLAVLLTSIFFSPDWPDRMIAALRRTAAEPSLPRSSTERPSLPRQLAKLPATFIALWLAAQLLIPLRHLAIPGEVNWTDEGERFSWRMMLRNKEPGYLEFRVVDPQLIRKDGNRGPTVDWKQWKPPRDGSEWFEIDSREIDFSALPKLFITYEPLIGERLFFNPAAADARSGDSRSQVEQAAELWQSRFGRRPKLQPIGSLARSFTELATKIGRLPDNRQQGRAEFLRGLVIASTVARRLESPELNEQEVLVRAAQLQTMLRRLVMYRPFRRLLLAILDKAQPLAALGARCPEIHLLVVHDRAIQRRGQGVLRRIRRNGSTRGLRAYLDLKHMLPVEMSRLPAYFIVRDARHRPRIVWNYAAELHLLQCRAVRSLTYVQRQYAGRIAEEWQSIYGRRPEVHVTSSLALNRHPLQPLVDPSVDLASAPLHLLRHNDWILPLQRRKASAAPADAIQP